MAKLSSRIAPKIVCGFLPLNAHIPRICTGSSSLSTIKFRRPAFVKIAARAEGFSDHQSGSGGHSFVDANMIVLRKRMYELKLQENNFQTLEDYTEWEKSVHPRYCESIFKALECLQFTLINTRPSIAIAVMVMMWVALTLSLIFVFMTVADSVVPLPSVVFGKFSA